MLIEADMPWVDSLPSCADSPRGLNSPQLSNSPSIKKQASKIQDIFCNEWVSVSGSIGNPDSPGSLLGVVVQGSGSRVQARWFHV